MLHELSDLGTSIDADGSVTPDLIDAVLESNAGVPLLDLGTRDNGHIAPVSPSEIDRSDCRTTRPPWRCGRSSTSSMANRAARP